MAGCNKNTVQTVIWLKIGPNLSELICRSKRSKNTMNSSTSWKTGSFLLFAKDEAETNTIVSNKSPTEDVSSNIIIIIFDWKVDLAAKGVSLSYVYIYI